jgi:hypothetical protein
MKLRIRPGALVSAAGVSGCATGMALCSGWFQGPGWVRSPAEGRLELLYRALRFIAPTFDPSITGLVEA